MGKGWKKKRIKNYLAENANKKRHRALAYFGRKCFKYDTRETSELQCSHTEPNSHFCASMGQIKSE